MDIGAFILPGLFILMLVVITLVTIYWVFDGSDQEELEADRPRRYSSGLNLPWGRRRKANRQG